MPANSFTLTVNKQVTVQEEVAPDLWQLSLERGEVAPDGTILSPTRIVALFRATGADGRYREDVAVLRREMVDLPQHWDPALHNFVTLMRGAIIQAVIPAVEPYVSLGVAGLTIEQAGPLLMGRYFTLLAQPEPTPPPTPNPHPDAPADPPVEEAQVDEGSPDPAEGTP